MCRFSRAQSVMKGGLSDLRRAFTLQIGFFLFSLAVILFIIWLWGFLCFYYIDLLWQNKTRIMIHSYYRGYSLIFDRWHWLQCSSTVNNSFIITLYMKNCKLYLWKTKIFTSYRVWVISRNSSKYKCVYINAKLKIIKKKAERYYQKLWKRLVDLELLSYVITKDLQKLHLYL